MPDEYVSEATRREWARLQGRDNLALARTVATDRAAALDNASARRELWAALAVAVGALAVWVGTHVASLRTLFKKEFAWWGDQYRQGPRPRGSTHFGMTCVCLAVDYPAFATLVAGVCGSLPQASAIFLLTMVQHYGDHMQGVHWSGSREQLNGKLFKTFVKSYAHWDTAANPWRFLFTSPTAFELSVAVQTARKHATGGTMLEVLYQGGLCAVATQFYDPDVTAAEMCRALLGEQLVYYMKCGALKLATAQSEGATIGTGATMGLHGILAIRRYRSAAQTASRSFRALANVAKAATAATQAGAGTAGAAGADAVEAGAVGAGTAEAGAVDGAAIAADSLAAPEQGVCATLALIPLAGWFLGPICESIVMIIVMTLLCVALTAISAAALDALMACPTGQYYTLDSKGGSLKRVEWDGDPADLPPRAR